MLPDLILRHFHRFALERALSGDEEYILFDVDLPSVEFEITTAEVDTAQARVPFPLWCTPGPYVKRATLDQATQLNHAAAAKLLANGQTIRAYYCSGRFAGVGEQVPGTPIGA